MHPEHDRPDLTAADPTFAVQRHRERLAWIGELRDVRQQRRGVQVDRVAPDRLHARHPCLEKRLPQVRRRADPISEIVLLDHLLQTLRDRLEIATRQPPVRGKALRQDQHVPAALGPSVIVERQPTADVHDGVLLGAHGHPIRERRHLSNDLADSDIGIAILALLDEPGVLREAAGIQEERQPVSVTDLAHRAQVLEADRLTAAGVVGDGDHDERHVLRPG